MEEDPGQALVSLGVQLLDLVRNGTRTATYKPATLLALVDVLAASADSRGRIRDEVPLRALGERVLELYWPQVREFDRLDGSGAVLRQLNDRRKEPVIVHAVRTLYVQARSRGAHSPGHAAALLPREHDAAVRAVSANLARYPLARLQRPRGYREGMPYDRPLYDDAAFGMRRPASDVLRLHPGVGERLVALSGLLVPVLQAEWTSQVAALNDLPSDALRQHLFGRERQDLGKVREVLRDLQHGACLYCGLGVRGGQVDHVVPWALHPEDSLENLVLTHDACNGAKGAYLLDVLPLTAWAQRDLAAGCGGCEAAVAERRLPRLRSGSVRLRTRVGAGVVVAGWHPPRRLL